MRQRGALLALAVAAVVVAGTTVSPLPAPRRADTPARPAPVSSTTLTVAAVGDVGSGSASAAVLSAIGRAEPDATFVVGDLSYGRSGGEQAWCDFVTARVGSEHPVEVLAGNHESDGHNGRIDAFVDCLPNRLPGLVGSYGREYYVDVPRDAPLARFIMVSPGLTFPGGETYSYAAGTPRYAWTSRAIDSARAAGIPWVVVGIHKPCLSTGQYACDSGTDLMDLMAAKHVDLVLHGHEHLYERTTQLALSSSCPSIPVDGYDRACVVDAGTDLTQGAGTVAVTVGTGGGTLRPSRDDDPEAGYFAVRSGSNRLKTHGYLLLRITPTRLEADFRPVDGRFSDRFSITR